VNRASSAIGQVSIPAVFQDSGDKSAPPKPGGAGWQNTAPATAVAWQARDQKPGSSTGAWQKPPAGSAKPAPPWQAAMPGVPAAYQKH
jgi:hypothetical protein